MSTDRIVCFGEALIDFLAESPTDPHEPRAFLQQAGGAPANVAVAVARLGGNAEFVGAFGTDMFGDFLLDSLRGSGVDTRYIQRTDVAPTALAFVSLDANGERSFSFRRPPAADLLFREADLPDMAFAAARIFHVCSNSLTEPDSAQTTFALMGRARAAGAMVSFDMNLRPALWPREADPTAQLWTALAATDLVRLSADEFAFIANPLGGEAAALAKLWQGSARCVVISNGAQPLRWSTPQASGSLAPPAVRAIDTTAAGDAFSGGLLQRLVELDTNVESLTAFATSAAFEDALRFASVCGALAVTRHGAFAAMPSRTEVDALLASTLPAAAAPR